MGAMMRGAIAAAVGLTIGVSATAAHAGNEVAAEALFMEAKKLAAQGKYAEACPKFAESNRLDRGAGTLIHLGDCYEKNKQTASAWAIYKEAASAAQALGRRDWEKLASQRAQTLEAKLARLTIKVDPPSYALEVARDGEKVTRASWNVAIPVDIGTHTVDASAPGYKPYKTTATVKKDGESVEVVVPPLEAEPAQTPPPAKPDAQVTVKPPPPGADSGSGSSQRTIGLVLGGVGVAGLAVGAVTGLMALGKSNDAKDACPADGGCANRDAVAASDDAKTFGLVSTIGFGAGAALAVGGAVLFFTAPSEKKTSFRISPRAGGLVLGGTFW
jgi:hypothetical protein